MSLKVAPFDGNSLFFESEIADVLLSLKACVARTTPNSRDPYGNIRARGWHVM